jgi:hypothetical protein
MDSRFFQDLELSILKKYLYQLYYITMQMDTTYMMYATHCHQLDTKPSHRNFAPDLLDNYQKIIIINADHCTDAVIVNGK